MNNELETIINNLQELLIKADMDKQDLSINFNTINNTIKFIKKNHNKEELYPVYAIMYLDTYEIMYK